MSPQQIYELLHTKKITSEIGNLTFNLAGVSFSVQTKDVVGGILQEWLENYLILNQVQFNKPSNSQDWPDLILLPQNEHLEVKAFDYTKSPNFDIANFDAYTRSLLSHPERLDTDHIIFGYISNGTTISIREFWIKKSWQMTGPSNTNFLNLQVKQNVPVNIRPKNWRGNVITFQDRRSFVRALDNAMTHFHPSRYRNWFQQVENNYQATVRQPL
jgi:NgoBV-like restriction endonuclease